jgi:hypothetical protein
VSRVDAATAHDRAVGGRGGVQAPCDLLECVEGGCTQEVICDYWGFVVAFELDNVDGEVDFPAPGTDPNYFVNQLQLDGRLIASRIERQTLDRGRFPQVYTVALRCVRSPQGRYTLQPRLVHRCESGLARERRRRAHAAARPTTRNTHSSLAAGGVQRWKSCES